MGLRLRRGILNFVGEISKILFGILDASDAECYNDQKRHFEDNAEDITELLKQHISVVNTTLGAINGTLGDVEYNGKRIKKGMTDIKHYLNSLLSETADKRIFLRPGL